MCHRVTCATCGRPTFTGCGAHVEQVLADVPAAERCQCAASGDAPPAIGRTTPGRRFANVAIALAILATFYFTFVRGTADISSGDARRLVAAGARLVDVRTVEEFSQGHIEGALNIPVQQLEARLGELAPADRPVVLYCRSGQRSRRAAKVLRSAGYTAVHDLGPMSAW